MTAAPKKQKKYPFPSCLSRLSPAPAIRTNAVTQSLFYTCDATGEPISYRVGLPARFARANPPAEEEEDDENVYGAFKDWNTLEAYVAHYRDHASLPSSTADQLITWIRATAIAHTPDQPAKAYTPAPPLSMLVLHGGSTDHGRWANSYVSFRGGAVFVVDDADRREQEKARKPAKGAKRNVSFAQQLLARATPGALHHLDMYVMPDLEVAAVRNLGIALGDGMLTELSKAAGVPQLPYATDSASWTYSAPFKWTRKQETFRKTLLGASLTENAKAKRKAATAAKQVAAREKKMEEVRAAYKDAASELKAMNAAARKKAGLVSAKP